MKKYLFLLLPLLLAFQCDEDDAIDTYTNTLRLAISAAEAYSVNDTIWIESRVSSKVYNTKIQDSIVSDYASPVLISAFKFITPSQDYNTKDALDKFEIIYPVADISFLGVCPNASFSAVPYLNSVGTLYTYKVGLRAKEAGDYVLYINGATIDNVNRHTAIIDNYPMPDDTFDLGLRSCNEFSYTDKDNDGLYCFSVN